MTFREKHLEAFKQVCRHLGNRWKVIQLPGEKETMIRLMNPELKKFTVEAFQSEGRIFLVGKVADDCYFKGQYCRCTVSLDRPPHQIAGDISRKLVVNSQARIAEYETYWTERGTEKARAEIIEAALSRLMVIDKERSWSRQYRYEQAASGLKGHIEYVSYNETYVIGVRGLSTDNMLKLLGFMTTLTP